jgi:hypothetical protein
MIDNVPKGLVFLIGFLLTFTPIFLLMRKIYIAKRHELKTMRKISLAISIAFAMIFAYYWILSLANYVINSFYNIDAFYGALTGYCGLLALYFCIVSSIISSILIVIHKFNLKR